MWELLGHFFRIFLTFRSQTLLNLAENLNSVYVFLGVLINLFLFVTPERGSFLYQSSLAANPWKTLFICVGLGKFVGPEIYDER